MHRPRRISLAQEHGLTLTEMMIVVVVVGIMMVTIAPRIAPLLSRTGAGQAASLVALDLEQAVSLASRQRRPVRVACDCANGSYTITDRGNGNVLFRRVVAGLAGGFGLSGLTFSTPEVDVFPSGQTSAPLTVSLASSGTTRRVSMSTGGFVRVIR
jgi:prepilin-type N-terminal cleavage/methylation domain-containing protein